MKISLRIVLVATLVAMVALLTTSPAQAFERVGNKKILVFGGRQPVPNLDPSQKYDWSTRMLQQGLYDGLVKYVGDPPNIEPWLAKSWESSPDGTVWTFHLVENAKFHDGNPVDAEAVKFTFLRTLKLNQGPAWMLSEFLKEDGVKVIDKFTIQFTLLKPYAPFLSYLPWWYIQSPKEVMAHEVDGDMGQKWMTENEAGSGPFRMKRWEQGVLYEIEAVPDYWKGWPNKNHIDGVIFKLIRESSSQKAALIKGEADIVEGLSPEDFELVANMKDINVPNFPGMTAYGIKFNMQKAPTDDIHLRKAVVYAFDYDALIKIYNGNAILQTSPFPHAISGHINVPGFYRQDLAQARAHLKQSRYPNGGVELEYAYVQGVEEERKMGLVLIDNLKPLNITVKMVPLTWPVLKGRGSKPDTSPDMGAFFVTPVSVDPDAVAYQYHKNSWGMYYGSSHYNNEEVWSLIETGRATVDWEKRRPIYEQIQIKISADAPEIFGMLYNRRWGMRNYVKGFQFSPIRYTGEVDLYPLYFGK